MATINAQIEKMTVDELVVLQNQLSKLIKKKQRACKRDLFEQFKVLAGKSGLSVNDVLGKESTNSLSAKPKKVYDAKYCNPADKSITWTGLGRRPKWVVAWQAAGKNMDGLLIK